MDFGAESGRAELITLRDGRVELEEIHRFPNRPVRMNDCLFWDFPYLYAGILDALSICNHRGVSLSGIGIDTWGVDFGLLGADGRLLSNPVHYRDSRTDNIHEYSDRFMSVENIFRATACEPWAISSLFQLLAIKRDEWPALNMAHSFLNMPDLFNYFLTGIKASERSIASTSNLMGINGEWSREVMDAFDLPDIFGTLIEPGTVLGPLSASTQTETGLGPIPVVATCGHDTAAVVASIPATHGNWAFLSSGTWSILGKTSDKPIVSEDCLEAGFSNEYTLGGWYHCRNIVGLWLVQELCRSWDLSSDPWDYERMTAEARDAVSTSMINVNDDAFMAPANMEEAILISLSRLGQPKPETRGELVRCVLESLALEYAHRLDMINDLTGNPSDTLYLVGGGTANKLLCQLTANACGIPVHAGVDQCTALGNGLTQAVAMNILKGPDEIRRVMRKSFELTIYEPRDARIWIEKNDKYKELIQNM